MRPRYTEALIINEADAAEEMKRTLPETVPEEVEGEEEDGFQASGPSPAVSFSPVLGRARMRAWSEGDLARPVKPSRSASFGGRTSISGRAGNIVVLVTETPRPARHRNSFFERSSPGDSGARGIVYCLNMSCRKVVICPAVLLSVVPPPLFSSQSTPTLTHT